MIAFEHVTRRFGRLRAVDDVSLTINAGESVALWGSNGAGKTTLLRCLLGLLRHRGTIRVDGVDARRRGKAVRARIGYVPQELGFRDDLRVDEAIRFFAAIKQARVAAVDDLLRPVGLPGQGRKRVCDLSGGMKQRLALALALVGEPSILVLDEVTAGLDVVGRADFVALLARLARSGDRTLLFASHRVDEIDALATRVVHLDGGRLVDDAPVADFVRRRARRQLLHLILGGDQAARAADVLRGRGFEPRMNGRGLLVPVSAGGRIEPIHTLVEARIRVHDFEILDADPTEGSRA